MILTVYQAARLFVGGVPRKLDGKIVNWARPCIGTRLELDWDGLAKWSATPSVEYAKESAGGYSLAAFRNNTRSKAACESVSALALDFDEGDARVERISSLLGAFQRIVYTTHSSALDAPRCRAIVACSRPMSAADYDTVWSVAAHNLLLAGIRCDTATRDPSRLWYAPARRPGGHWGHQADEGRTLDVDDILARDVAFKEASRLAREANRASGGASLARMRAYVAAIPGAVSGQGGHNDTFRVACAIVGNVTSEADQAVLLAEYNERCSPPWSKRELAHKLQSARNRADLSVLPDIREGT